jgi:hypothetical protein
VGCNARETNKQTNIFSGLWYRRAHKRAELFLTFVRCEQKLKRVYRFRSAFHRFQISFKFVRWFTSLNIWTDIFVSILYHSYRAYLYNQYINIKTDRRLYAYCAQNINSYGLILEASHCHTVLISRNCNFMFVNFMYCRISIIQSLH